MFLTEDSLIALLDHFDSAIHAGTIENTKPIQEACDLMMAEARGRGVSLEFLQRLPAWVNHQG